MNCGANTIKYILFIFNLIFSLCGLALIICGVLVHKNVISSSSSALGNISIPTISVIVVGSIIFFIAFFGCCGAIKESHCMVIVYAISLLSILIIQIGLAIYVFVVLKGLDDTVVTDAYNKIFYGYWKVDEDRSVVDAVQSQLQCCGAHRPQDFLTMEDTKNIYPWSCCPTKENNNQNCKEIEVYQSGCDSVIMSTLRKGGKLLGGIILGIAGVELIGVIFALCLANSIKNADRRALRV